MRPGRCACATWHLVCRAVLPCHACTVTFTVAGPFVVIGPGFNGPTIDLLSSFNLGQLRLVNSSVTQVNVVNLGWVCACKLVVLGVVWGAIKMGVRGLKQKEGWEVRPDARGELDDKGGMRLL